MKWAASRLLRLTIIICEIRYNYGIPCGRSRMAAITNFPDIYVRITFRKSNCLCSLSIEQWQRSNYTLDNFGLGSRRLFTCRKEFVVAPGAMFALRKYQKMPVSNFNPEKLRIGLDRLKNQKDFKGQQATFFESARPSRPWFSLLQK